VAGLPNRAGRWSYSKRGKDGRNAEGTRGYENLRIYSITYHFVAIGVLALSVIDNHDAEGSLPPIITRTIIFDKIPTAMPFFLRES